MKRIAQFFVLLIVLALLWALPTALADAADNGFYAYAKGTFNTYANVTTEPGIPLTMSVDAFCNQGELHYQWRLGSESIEGATQASYTTSVINPYISYYCDVTDDYRNSGTISFYVRVDNNLQMQAKGTAYPKVAPGEALTLEVDASCKVGTLHYKWAHNYQIIESATESSFTTGNIDANTTFECYVTDDYNNSGTVFFEVSLDNELRARQLGNYSWNTSNSTSWSTKMVEFGSSVVLKVAAECKVGAIHYQWIKGYQSYDNIETAIEGATEASYIVESIKTTETYCCVVTDDYGITVRVPITVKIDNGLTAMQVGDQVGDFGDIITRIGPDETATLTVKASCKSGEVHYQWYDNSSVLIEGATEPSYTTEALPYRAWSYCYKCRVTDDYGNLVDISCYVNVSNGFSANPMGSDSWIVDLKVEPGKSALLEIEASCQKGEIHYEWRSGSSTGSVIENEINAHFTTEPINTKTEYYCIVTDDYGGTATVGFRVGVENGLEVEEEEYYFYVAPHSDLTLKVVASCERGDLQYTWKQFSKWDYETIDDAEGSSFGLEDITGHDYSYLCEVKDQYGNTENTYFYVYVNNNFYVRRITDDYYVQQPLGESVTLEVGAGCDDGSIHFQWRTQANKTYRWVDVEGANGPVYVVPPVTERSYYQCVVADDYGESKEIGYCIIPDNELVVERDNLPEEISVRVGETVTLKIAARCKDGTLTYRWYNNGEVMEDADGPSIITEPVVGNISYYVTVSDEYGNDVDLDFHISVDNGFSAEADGDTLITRKDGMPVTMKVKVTHSDDQPLSYSWYGPEYDEYFDEWDTGVIEGADGASYTLAGDAPYGTYSCYVEDQYGNGMEISFEIKQEDDYSVEAICDKVLYLSAGQTADLGVKITGKYDQVRITWFGDAWYTNDALIEGADAAIYTTPPLTETTGFWCKVDGPYGRTETFDFLCIVQEKTLALDQTIEVDFASDDARYYTFTPKKSGEYTLEPGKYIHIALFDADLNYLEDNDHGDNSPFYELTYKLNAGQKYIYKVGKNGRGRVMGMTIRLTCLGEEAVVEYDLMLCKGQAVMLPGMDGSAVTVVATENKGIVSASGNTIKAVAVGTTRVNVSYADGRESVYTVNVFNESVITLPATLLQIEKEAFVGDGSLRFVVLGNLVETVEKQAFDGSGLRQIVVSSTATQLNRGSLNGTDNPTIVCPQGSYAEQYAKTNGLTYVYLK